MFLRSVGCEVSHERTAMVRDVAGCKFLCLQCREWIGDEDIQHAAKMFVEIGTMVELEVTLVERRILEVIKVENKPNPMLTCTHCGRRGTSAVCDCGYARAKHAE